MNKILVKIGEAAAIIGSTPATLRKWEKNRGTLACTKNKGKGLVIMQFPISRMMICNCGNVMDRDLNAAINIEQYGLDTLAPDLKRAQETCKTNSSALSLTARR